MFKNFPKVERPNTGFKARTGREYLFEAWIYEDRASYSIDGKVYAKATYKKGDVPSSGSFGFAAYGNVHQQISILKSKNFEKYQT